MTCAGNSPFNFVCCFHVLIKKKRSPEVLFKSLIEKIGDHEETILGGIGQRFRVQSTCSEFFDCFSNISDVIKHATISAEEVRQVERNRCDILWKKMQEIG